MSSRDDRIDELARSLADPLPRRRVIRLLVSGFFGFLVARPKRAAAKGTGCRDVCGHGNPCGSEVMSGGNLGCLKYCCATSEQPVCCVLREGVGWCCEEGFTCGPTGSKPCLCEPPNMIEHEGARRVCRPCPEERSCPSGCCKPGEQCIHGECKPYCPTEVDPHATHAYDPQTQCCTKYGIEQKYPIQNYERCRETRVTHDAFKLDPKDLYCGPKGKRAADHYGKANFLPACVDHDKCYSRCRSDKTQCDDAFTKAITAACNGAYGHDAKTLAGCMKTVADYTTAVTLGATVIGAYSDAQSEACQCCT